jgi:hypothetical protein
MANHALPTQLTSRRGDVDLARVLIVGGLFFFHSARVFDQMSPFYVRNDPLSPALTLLVGWALLWGMPLLFLVSGVSAWHSLRVRTPGQFLRERVRRLLLPLLTGLLLLVPPQIYLGLRTDPGYQEPYLRFLPHFFDVTLAPRFPFFVVAAPPSGLFELAQLWFLWALFAYSLLLCLYRAGILPALGRWRASRTDVGGRATLPIPRQPAAILLLALPLALIEAALGTAQAGGWNVNAYLVLLFYGYWMAGEPRYQAAMSRCAWPTLWLGLAAYAALAVWGFPLAAGGGGAPLVGYAWSSVGWRLLKGLSGWFWIVALIGLGGRIAARPAPSDPAVPSSGRWRRLLRYANEAVLPVYVLHQTVIVALSFYVVRWPVGVLPKYLAISLGSLALTLAVYELCIRRIPLLRFLLGMKALARR